MLPCTLFCVSADSCVGAVISLAGCLECTWNTWKSPTLRADCDYKRDWQITASTQCMLKHVVVVDMFFCCWCSYDLLSNIAWVWVWAGKQTRQELPQSTWLWLICYDWAHLCHCSLAFFAALVLFFPCFVFGLTLVPLWYAAHRSSEVRTRSPKWHDKANVRSA